MHTEICTLRYTEGEVVKGNLCTLTLSVTKSRILSVLLPSGNLLLYIMLLHLSGESYVLKNVIHRTNLHAIAIWKRVRREGRQGLLSREKYLLLSGFTEPSSLLELNTQ